MSCNQPFSFTSSYQCSGSDNKTCQAAITWDVKYNGAVIKTGTGAGSIAGSFTPSGNGTYTITLYAVCNGIKCPPCTYTGVVNNCCDCGTWNPLIVNQTAATAGIRYNCGSTIQWNGSQPLNFTDSYQCSSKNCQAVTSWRITQGAVLIASGNGTGTINGNFTPTAAGTYTLTLNASCNGQKCLPCVIYIQITIEPCPTLCNGDFEQILNGLAPSDYVQTDQANIPCWKTTASDHEIEIWHSGLQNITAHTGTYFAEINATMAGALYQTFTINSSHTVSISFAHRGRYSGLDEMKVSLIYPNGTSLSLGTYDDNNQAWRVYTTPSHTIGAGTYTLKFESVYSDGGKGPVDGGNFLDSVSIICTDRGANGNQKQK
jgi:hypothetical protein